MMLFMLPMFADAVTLTVRDSTSCSGPAFTVRLARWFVRPAGGWPGPSLCPEGKEGGNSASMMAGPTRGVLGTIVPKGVGLSTTDKVPLPKIFIHRDLCGMHTATNRHHIYVYL